MSSKPLSSVESSDHREPLAESAALAETDIDDVIEACMKRLLENGPVTNPTDRTLTLYVTCSSADDRWRFEPVRIAPVELDARQSRQLAMTASYRVDRVPESAPSCSVRLPFQTAGGHWLDFERTVTGSVSGTRSR